MQRANAICAAWWWGALAERDRVAGRYARAEGHLRRSLAALRLAGRLDGALAMSLWNLLGITLKGEGRFPASARAYRMAHRLACRNLGADDARFASLYHNLAGLEHARERYELAEPLARQGLSLRERALGEGHADVARDLAALAAILDGRGRHVEAEVLHRRALAIFERAGRMGRREVAYTLANLAACLHLDGRRGESVAVARKAVEMQQRLLGPDHPEVKLSEANLAVIVRGSSE